MKKTSQYNIKVAKLSKQKPRCTQVRRNLQSDLCPIVCLYYSMACNSVIASIGIYLHENITQQKWSDSLGQILLHLKQCKIEVTSISVELIQI